MDIANKITINKSNTKMNKLIIDKSNTNGLSPLGTRVYLNGIELHGVTATMLDISVDDISKFTIELIGEIEIINKPNDKES